MSESVRELVTGYVTAAGDKRFDRIAQLVHPDATFGLALVVFGVVRSRRTTVVPLAVGASIAAA
jgi:hypothetical protein